MSPCSSIERPTKVLVAGLFILATIILIIAYRLAYSGLWIDEITTYWVVEDSIKSVVSRAVDYQGQSPFYYLLVWAVAQFAGFGKLGLRLLSVFSGLASGVLLFFIARRLFDARVAIVSTALMFCLTPVQAMFFSARPYGFCLALVNCSIYCLVRWRQEQKMFWLLLYVLSSVSVVYGHYLFVAVLLIHVLYILVCALPISAKRNFLFSQIAIVLLVLPSLPQVFLLSAKTAILRPMISASFEGLVTMLLPFPVLVILLLSLVWLAPALFRKELRQFTAFEAAVLIGSWLFVSPIFLYVASKLFGHGVLVDRYGIWRYPALALLGGVTISGLSIRKRTKEIVFCIIAFCLLLPAIRPRQLTEDWEGATNYLRETVRGGEPVLIYNGLGESQNVESLREPERGEFFKTVLRYYGFDGATIVIPFFVKSTSVDSYWEEVLRPAVAKSGEALCIVRNMLLDGKESVVATQEKFNSFGFEVRDVRHFGSVFVFKVSPRVS